MPLLNDHRIVLIEISNIFSCGKTPLNEIIDNFYETKISDEIQNKRSETKYILSIYCRKLFDLDNIIDQLTERKISSRNLIVRNCIRLALIELIYLKNPDYAVINSWVEISKNKKRTFHFSKLVNAVLRNFLRKKIKSNLSAIQQIPEWLSSVWIKDFGEETTIDIINASLLEPPLDITYKNQLEKNEHLEILPSSFRIYKSGKISEIKGYEDGAWWVQDAGATIPAHLFGHIKNKKVLDICSAPGGKAMQLSSMGADVVSVEISKKRIKLMQKNFDRTQLQSTIINQDILKWNPDEKFEFILIDAPCWATGTIRKNPDLMHIKDATEIDDHISVQMQILEKAKTLTAHNGTIIYCVCSLQANEGINQIESFLSNNKDFQRSKIEIDDYPVYKKFLTEDGDIQTLPHLIEDGGIDGFFISRLYKKV